MAAKVYTIQELREKLIPVFSHAPVYKAVLFGSYARGDADEKSDVDIVIDSKGELRGINFFGVVANVEDVLSKNADVFEISQIQRNVDMLQSIDNYGVVLYEKQPHNLQ